jgi:hypothetical protein
MMHASSKQNFSLLLEANNVRIDRDLRRAAAGSQQAANDELSHDALRHGRGAVPVPVPIPAAPTHAASPYDPAALAGAPAQEFLPAIGGGAPGTVSFPAGAPTGHPQQAQPAGQQPAQPQQAQPQPGQPQQGHPAGPQQPRPQPGIMPDLPGHNAA